MSTINIVILAILAVANLIFIFIIIKQRQLLKESNEKYNQSLTDFYLSQYHLGHKQISIDNSNDIIKKVMGLAKDHNNILIENNNYFVISRCKYGKFKLDVFDLHVSRSMLLYGEWMDEEISLLNKILHPGDIVFDVGANIGTHTIPFAQFVGPRGRVLAFEPQPNIVKILSTNVSMNGLDNVEIIPKVVCETENSNFTVNLEDKEALEGNRAGVSFSNMEKNDGEILSISLDHFNPLIPRLLKIDVEGMGANVFRGAKKLIANSRPIIYAENHEKEFSAALLHEIFSLDYNCYWHLVLAFNPNNYLGMSRDIWGGQGHNINILCLPKEKELPLEGLIRIESEEEWITDKIDIDFSKDLTKHRISVESIKGLDF
jgi:FkbM family methyltransferase